MAVHERNARAHLERVEGFRFTATFPDVPGSVAVTLDEPTPLGADAGPNPASLLAAAIGDCLAASLVFCMRKARVDPLSLTADAVAHIVRNDAGRMRIGGVDVTLSLEVASDEHAGVERCRPLFEDFCIVTESVRHGIPVNVQVNVVAEALAPAS